MERIRARCRAEEETLPMVSYGIVPECYHNYFKFTLSLKSFICIA